jgi:hypothetical protein
LATYDAITAYSTILLQSILKHNKVENYPFDVGEVAGPRTRQ